MAHAVLGLDIGGANLKAAWYRTDDPAASIARNQPFALWKDPAGLPDILRACISSLPSAAILAVTMTGELCDCFESKRVGVLAILDAVQAVAGGKPVHVWCVDGRFRDLPGARATPLQAAAANWLALATFAGRFAPR